MTFSSPALHPAVIQSEEQKSEARLKFDAIAEQQQAARKASTAVAKAGSPFSVSLTTVSYYGNFDAYITVHFGQSASARLLVDSGNSMLIIPHWEAIQGLSGYTILGTAKEPWGCPANVVLGPVELLDTTGATHTIPDCIFYACTANNKSGERTANFGAGHISPWSASGWNTPVPGFTMQAPLSYLTDYPYAELMYAPAPEIFHESGELNISESSLLVLHPEAPEGYTMLDTIQELEWMSVIPQSLSIGGEKTAWPGFAFSPIAMVDTGGGPAFLSDPNGYVYNSKWPDPVSCPSWTSRSTNCNCISDKIGIGLGDGTSSYSYVIDPADLPAPAQGLTAVMCQENSFMMGHAGMNIGGISALFNSILIDYSKPKVGFKKRQP